MCVEWVVPAKEKSRVTIYSLAEVDSHVVLHD